MRIIHIVHGKVNPNGANGISRVVYFLNKYQKSQGFNSEIWAFVDGVNAHQTYKRDEFVTVEMFPRLTLFKRMNHPMLKKFLNEKNSIDIVHFHMIWFLDKNILANFLKKQNVPFVAMTHGTYSTPVSYKGKKQIARFLLEKPFLNKAREIHALTPEEESLLIKYGVTTPAFIVPNGMDIDQIPSMLSRNYFINKQYASKIKIGWIGVYREDKNLDLIVKAFHRLPEYIKKQCHFIFMGPDHKETKIKLIGLCKTYGCNDSFDFLDAVYFREKYEALNSFDVYIMASLSEGLSLAILDAMALGKPMVLTRGCNMTYYYRNDFYEMCECTPSSIANGIERIYNRRKDWDNMGHNAQQLIKDVFNWESVVKQLTCNYKRILSDK